MADKQLKLTAVQVKEALADKHADDYFITEVKTGPSWYNNKLRIMDAVAVKRSWANPMISAYEIKVSKSDFKGDNKWPAYMPFCDCFSFVCPKGLISADDVAAISEHHPGVGLIHVNGAGNCRTVIKALNRHVPQSPDLLMYIIMSKLESDRHPFHSTRLEYFRDWLADKRDRAMIGHDVGGRMAEIIREQRAEIDRLKNFKWKETSKPDARLTAAMAGLYEWNIDRLIAFLKLFKNPSDLLAVIKAAENLATIYQGIKTADSGEDKSHGR